MTLSQDTAVVSTDTIREIYRSDPGDAEKAIELRLEQYCKDMTDSEKFSTLNTLLDQFEAPSRETGVQVPGANSEMLKAVFSLMLGRKISTDVESPQEILDRLSSAMDTLFGTLNRIVKTINTALMENTTGEQTIRHVIGSQLEGHEGIEPLEEYLGRIEKAFLVSHRAFKQAAHTIVRKIIKEIRPEGFAAEADKGFKFAPMRKAEYFEIYKNKYIMLEKWFESGRFMNDLLREFENNCQASI